ncbi:hypothetical protein DSL92_07165 [Billgrantia gudaonensis]|uniref:Uncharacterized protein n=1 Tax=Billgrantia gudaonensis TaxID=376427 RepID=A0A432JIG3_9GAMM|nr:hypothetical protein DSL92_07165 [Halomonas gudaonensis]
MLVGEEARRITAMNHTMLAVTVEGRDWLVDVGVGNVGRVSRCRSGRMSRCATAVGSIAGRSPWGSGCCGIGATMAGSISTSSAIRLTTVPMPRPITIMSPITRTRPSCGVSWPSTTVRGGTPGTRRPELTVERPGPSGTSRAAGRRASRVLRERFGLALDPEQEARLLSRAESLAASVAGERLGTGTVTGR